MASGLSGDVKDVVGIDAKNTANTTDLVSTISVIANILIGIIAAVSVFFVIKGAWEWINGNEKNKAQQTIINAVIGVVVAILAFVIVQFFTGGALFLNQTLK